MFSNSAGSNYKLCAQPTSETSTHFLFECSALDFLRSMWLDKINPKVPTLLISMLGHFTPDQVHSLQFIAELRALQATLLSPT